MKRRQFREGKAHCKLHWSLHGANCHKRFLDTETMFHSYGMPRDRFSGLAQSGQ